MTSRRNSSDMKLIRSLLVIVIAYLIMWCPFMLVSIVGDTIAHRNAYIFSVLLAHTNSSVNCIIYAATNRNFREGYIYFLRRVFGFCRGAAAAAAPAWQSLSNFYLSATQKTIDIEDQV